MIAMIAVAIVTSPKSAGTSRRASMTMLTIPIERSRSLNTTIHAAPAAILDPRLAAIQGRIRRPRHCESGSSFGKPLPGSATPITSKALHIPKNPMISSSNKAMLQAAHTKALACVLHLRQLMCSTSGDSFPRGNPYACERNSMHFGKKDVG